jgi:glycosyltransferase involved in cell wall biosynthesis
MIDHAPAATRTRVLLLRDTPERKLLSMERLSDELERGMAAHPRLAMTATTLHESATAARVGLRRIDSYVTRFLRYPLAASRRRADVYHVVDHGYGHVAALLPRERVVMSCHDLMLMRAAEGDAGFRPGRASLARFRWSTSYLRRAARVVTPSETTKRDVVRLRGVSPDRISVVPYGVDGRFRPMSADERAALRAKLVGPHRHALLHVSTGDPYKNVPGTLRVLAELRARGGDVALVRVGKPLTAAERDVARALRIEDAIIDAGRVTDERLVEIYNACDVLLFPSFYEGYGWPPLEAMACGTPVVASDCPSLVEIADGAALLAPARDVAALARAVQSLLDSDELAADMRARGIARAAQYTWRRTVDGFAFVYERVAEEARERARAPLEDRSCAA